MTQVVPSNMLITKNSLYTINARQCIWELVSLQKRIYKATIDHNYKLVYRLQRLLLISESTKFILLSDITNHYFKIYGTLPVNVSFKSLFTESTCFNLQYKPQHVLTNNLDTIQIHSFFVEHVIIPNLHDKVISNLIYLSLKPEWEAKFCNYFSNSVNKTKHNYLHKINAILNLCSQYNQYFKTKFCKIYVLKNKVDILYYTHNQYWQGKLGAIDSVNKFIKKFLITYSTCDMWKKDNNNFNFQDINVASSALLSLLKNIVMEDLNNEIYLYKNLFADIIHKNDSMFKLSRFLYHEGYFIFFSHSKNEVVFVKQQVTNLLTNIGLAFNRQNIQILEFRKGFNFLDLYIRYECDCMTKHSFHGVSVQASMKSQLVLLKKIKNILYHKDSFNRIRPNTYLSFWSAIAKVKYLVLEWKSYYLKFDDTSKIAYIKLNESIRVVLHRWHRKNKNRKITNIHLSSGLDNKLKVKNLIKNHNW